MNFKKSYWIMIAVLILFCSTAIAFTTGPNLPTTLSGVHKSDTDTFNPSISTVESNAKALVLITNTAKKVTLKPGFHAKNGSMLKIKISNAFPNLDSCFRFDGNENCSTDNDGYGFG
ncbi:MAG: hypothetical protein C0403_03310, partial [Desulfobacterium sp.]|nr:hypothetical protein [Desulfobacterium sp.]